MLKLRKSEDRGIAQELSLVFIRQLLRSAIHGLGKSIGDQ